MHQLVWRIRLGQQALRASLAGLCGRATAGGDEDGQPGIDLLESVESLPSAHRRHLQVEYQEIKGPLLGSAQSLSHIGRHHHVAADTHERDIDELEHRWVVVEDEHRAVTPEPPFVGLAALLALRALSARGGQPD